MDSSSVDFDDFCEFIEHQLFETSSVVYDYEENYDFGTDSHWIKRQKVAVSESLYLPVEIWEEVISKVDEQDLEQLSLVSKQFLSITNSFKSTLKISNQTLPRRVLLRFQNLENIIICIEPVVSLLCVLHHISRSRLTDEARNRLKKLEFRGPTSFSFEENFDIISKVFPMLEEISFTYVHCSEYILNSDGFQKLASNLKNLKKIAFEGDCSFLSDKSIISLSSNSKDLEKIRINGHYHKVTENAIGFVMRNSHKLTSLTLRSLIDSPSNSSFSIKNSIVYAKKLHTLCFYDTDISNEILCSIARANPPLKKLAISEKKYKYREIDVLFKSVCSIEDLQLDDVYLDNSILNSILHYLTKLTRVDLSWCGTLDNHCFFLLLNNCPLLKEITMDRAKVGCGDTSRMELHKHGRIQCLSLRSNEYLDDKTLKIIARVCPNLQFLNISSSTYRITGKGISKLVKSCCFLTHLEINGFKASSIFGKLSKGRSLNLKVIIAWCSKWSDEAMGEIGKICSNLEFLDISGCERVTEVGVMEVVRNCKKLEKIGLINCPNLRIVDLNRMVKTRPSLKKILIDRPLVPSEVRW